MVQVLQLTLSLGRLERIKLLERELTAPPNTAEMAARLANAALEDSTTGNSPTSYTDAESSVSGALGDGDGPTAGQVATARQVLQRYYEHRVPGLGERVDISPDPTLQVCCLFATQAVCLQTLLQRMCCVHRCVLCVLMGFACTGSDV